MKKYAASCSEKNNKKSRLTALYAVGLSFLLFSVLLGAMLGTSPLSLSELVGVVCVRDLTSPAARILLYVRLPRTVASLLCGAALSVAGAVIQGVLANRLASPSIIGVNSGAGLAVTCAAALGIYGGFRMSLLSFLGAFLTVLFVSMVAGSYGTRSGTLILIGVAVNALLGAVSDSIVAFYPDISTMTFDFRVGDFSSVTYQKIVSIAPFVIGAIIVLLLLSKELDVLSLGDDNARGLGMNTTFVRITFLVLTALLSGCAVSCAGMLSFVGLMVPHAIRRISHTRHFHLISLCAIYGGGFVSLSDTLARTVFSPYELPVGIIMAFLGAPFFVFILMRGKGGVRDA